MPTNIRKRNLGRSLALVGFAASALSPLVACWPVHLPALSEIHGLVVDASSGAPVAGAKITVDPRNFDEDPVVATSDGSGEFVVGPKTHLAMVPFFSEAWPLNLATIHAEAPGYQPADAIQDDPDVRRRQRVIKLRPERR